MFFHLHIFPWITRLRSRNRDFTKWARNGKYVTRTADRLLSQILFCWSDFCLFSRNFFICYDIQFVGRFCYLNFVQTKFSDLQDGDLCSDKLKICRKFPSNKHKSYVCLGVREISSEKFEFPREKCLEHKKWT